MIDLLTKRVGRAATIRNTAICALVFLMLLFVINGKPFGVAQLKAYTNGIGILDLEGTYTPEEAYHLLDLQGEQGRSFYKNLLIRLDILFPLSYSLLWMFLISLIYKRTFTPESKMQSLCLVPAFAGICDWLENIFILTVLGKYPMKDITAVSMANTMTVTKGLLTEISIVLIVAGLARILYRKLRKV